MIKEFLGLKKNNKGQIALESVLLMTVLLGGFMFLTGEVQKRNLLANLFKKPIESVKTMTAYGTWKSDGCTAPGKSKQTLGKCHPNSIARSLSSNPQ